MSVPIPDATLQPSDFELLEIIGKGQFATVYKASEVQTGQTVAIKLIPIDPNDERMTALYGREIAVMQQTSPCEHVLRYYGHFVHENQIGISMQYCAAGSVTTIIKATEIPFGEPVIASVAAQVLKGLHHLHSHRFLHRDIKGANILAHRDGTVQLADFGISCAVQLEDSKRNSVLGTPYYMAPEVLVAPLSNRGYNNKADIWSFGITVIEMAEMQPPFAHEDPMRAAMKIPLEPAPTLEGLQWSKPLRDLVSKCCVKDPALRWSAEQLLAEDPFLVGCPGRRVFAAYLDSCWGEIEMFQAEDFNVGVNATLGSDESLSSISLSELSFELCTAVYIPSPSQAISDEISPSSSSLKSDDDGTMIWHDHTNSSAEDLQQYEKAVANATEASRCSEPGSVANKAQTKTPNGKKSKKKCSEPLWGSSKTQFHKLPLIKLLAAEEKLEADHKARLEQVTKRFNDRIQAYTNEIGRRMLH